MLSKVPERRDAAHADFYRKPPSKRKHDGDTSGGEQASPMSAAKVVKHEKVSAIQGLVSWVENSSLPSKSMVLAEMASLTYPKACLDVLQAVKKCFHVGLLESYNTQAAARTPSSSHGAADSQPFFMPGRNRLSDLVGDVMKPLTLPAMPMERYIRYIPLARGSMAGEHELHPVREAQLCMALVKTCLEPLPSTTQDGAADQEHSLAVHWYLLDELFTPLAHQALVTSRIATIASLSLSLKCAPLLSALARWILCYDEHCTVPLPSSSSNKTSGRSSAEASRVAAASQVIDQLIRDFIFSTNDLSPLSCLPSLSLDMAALFLAEFSRKNPVLQQPATASAQPSASDLCLPPHNLMVMAADWLAKWPALSLISLRSTLPQNLVPKGEWSPKWATTPAAVAAKTTFSCPLEGLLSWLVFVPLASRVAGPGSAGTGNSVTGTMEISRAYEETTALLHGQVMLALSLHRAPAADDQQGRRPGGLCTASQPIQFSGDSLVLLASQLCLIQELGDGVDVSALMQGSVERFSQLLQVMTSANIVALTEDQLASIVSTLPENRLLTTVVEFIRMSQHR